MAGYQTGCGGKSQKGPVKTTREHARRFEFCFPMQDVLVLVEESESGVLIRATRDCFSAERKTAFVRELAMEGFISDQYRWATLDGAWSCFGIRWSVDYSWLVLSEEVLARTRRFMLTILLSGAGLWVAQMTALFMFARR